MKRSFAIVALFVLLGFVSTMAAAQTAAGTTQPSNENLYIKTMYISKIYPHNLGYKVNYWTGDGKISTTYIPLSWFSGTNGKGEIVAQFGRSIPYMEVVYSSGKFKFVRLHVAPNYSDLSWGSLNGVDELSGMFKAETLEIVY